MSITIGISIGDPNGIGPEVVLKTFSDAKYLAACTPIIYAHVDFVVQQADYFNLQLPHRTLAWPTQTWVLNVVTAGQNRFNPVWNCGFKSRRVCIEIIAGSKQALQQALSMLW